MSRLHIHQERHVVSRIAWLRAAVLGANDGVVSTASLIVGVASAGADRNAILIAGVAGLVAGAMSMAAGEFVSVSSQSDAERADLAREKEELKNDPAFELKELTAIYESRGLDHELAIKVAKQLMEKDALKAHARDELSITDLTTAKPLIGALASASSFTLGAFIPLIIVPFVTLAHMAAVVTIVALMTLAGLGALGAGAGGAPKLKAILRVTLWGAFAMAATALIGRLFGAVV